MTYDYDLAVIGLGPAGMAVSIMGSEMGLKVAAIEAHKVGGECMNVGCIPSKALLRAAKVRHLVSRLPDFGLSPLPLPSMDDTFGRIQNHLKYISEKKTMAMFAKVKVILGQGRAAFVDEHTLSVGGQKLSAKRIYIAAGTRPALPDIPGIDQVKPLTNETMFNLEKVPASLIVIGSGAIACEMAQAFARLGSRVTMVMRGQGLLWREDEEARTLLEESFAHDGIELKTHRHMTNIQRRGGQVILDTQEDGQIVAEQVLAATGRRLDLADMKLDQAGIAYTDQAITVNRYLQTSRKHIYAVGDCNGHAQFSHAAMHQGMLAIMNSMMPWPMKQDFRKYLVPWTVFTDPQISHVGPRASQLKEQGMAFETVTVRHEDYGAAIAENLGRGFVKALVSPAGRIYAATIVGEGSGEMINQWGQAIQNKLRMHQIMLLQHSFPTMSFLTKRASETWMMNRMKSDLVKKMATFFFRV